MLEGVKKLFIAIILSLVVFSTAASYFLYPQRANAQWLTEDIGQLALQAQGLVKQAKDYVLQSEQLMGIIETVKTGHEIYSVGRETYDFIAQENYGAITKGILGYAGLGSLSPIMDKFLNGVGLKDILVDEVGGALGLGGILQGGLQGIFTQEDTIHSLLGQFGVKIPSSTVGKLKDLGIFSPEGIMKAITCGGESGSGAAKPPPSGENLPEGGDEKCDSTVTPNIVEKCSDTPPSGAKPKWCFDSTAQPEIGAQGPQCSATKDDCISMRKVFEVAKHTVTGCVEQPAQNSTGVQGTQTGPRGGDVLADTTSPPSDCDNILTPNINECEGTSTKPSVSELFCFTATNRWGVKGVQCDATQSLCDDKKEAFKSVNHTVTLCRKEAQAPTGNTSQPSGNSSAPSSGGCGQPGGVASDPSVIDNVKGVLKKFGLTGLDDNTIAKLVDQGIVDVETANQYIEPTTVPKPTTIINPSPPCVEWLETGGCKKIRTSFSGDTDDTKDIPTDPAAFVLRFFTILLGFAGGIALLLMIFAGYKLITSSGKPEQVQQGRDQLIAAIVGLIFIIFSFVIFQLIVVDILKIPGICKDPNDPRCQIPASTKSEPEAKWCNKEINGVNKVVPCDQALPPKQTRWCFSYTNKDGNTSAEKCGDTEASCTAARKSIDSAGTALNITGCSASEFQPGPDGQPKPSYVEYEGGCWDDTTTTEVKECESDPPGNLRAPGQKGYVPPADPVKPQPDKPAQPAKPAGGNWVQKPDPSGAGGTCWDDLETPKQECEVNKPQPPAQPDQPALPVKDNWVKDNKDSQNIPCWDNKATPEPECKGEKPEQTSTWVKDNKDSQNIPCWDDKSTPEPECRGENPDASFFDIFPLF